MAGVATDLNQLTAKLHATGDLDESLAAVVEALERISARTDDAVDHIAAGVRGRSRSSQRRCVAAGWAGWSGTCSVQAA